MHKANGMHFKDPLLHDDVQATATQALLDNGLYATCNYLTEIVPNYKTSNGRMYHASL